MRVTMVMASTADGKIGPVDRSAIDFGAPDKAHLERQVAAADVLVMGAGALRSYGTTMVVKDADLLARRAAAGQPPQPTTCIVTRGELHPELPFFRRQDVPRVIATTDEAAPTLAERLGERAEVWGLGAGQVDLARLHDRLVERGFARMALLGGGALNAAWLAVAPLHHLELTVAPLLVGGAAAPTLLDGDGLPAARRLTLSSVRREGDLLFLRYDVQP